MITRFISLAATVVILALGGYIVWSSYSSAPAVSKTELTEQIAKQLAEVRKIQKVNPNLGLLNDKLFQALQPSGADLGAVVFGTSTPGIARGRSNPFSPF